jgi:hypothetical protein
MKINHERDCNTNSLTIKKVLDALALKGYEVGTYEENNQIYITISTTEKSIHFTGYDATDLVSKLELYLR